MHFTKNHQQKSICGGLRLSLALAIFALSLTHLSAINPADVFIENKSGPSFILDKDNPCQLEPGAAYVAYRICNVSGETLTGLKAELGGFDSGFGLAGGQMPIQNLHDLEPGGCHMVFWYVGYPCEVDETTSMTMTLSDGEPGTVTSTDQMGIENSKITGNGAQVSWMAIGNYFTDEGEICVDVEYKYKNVKKDKVIYFQPATNLDFEADCLQLTRFQVMDSEIEGIPEGEGQRFHYVLPEKADDTKHVYVRYYFKANCQSFGSNIEPFTTATGGNTQLKHSGNNVSTEVDLPTSLVLPCEFVPGEEFELRTMESGNNWGMAWGDYDGDGYVDLFVTTNDITQPNELYRNNGDGTFTQITEGLIVEELAPSLAASWADYDNDGDLDLYVGNNIGYNNFLYRNEGGGEFVSIKNDPIVDHTGYSHGVSWGDFDNDGYLDLFVATYWETEFNKLYRNNGDGTFSNVTNNPIVNEASRSVSGSWADYDGDGWLDLFVANLEGRTNSLYRNLGGKDFEKIENTEMVAEPSWSVGGSWADYDNDGDLDLFVANASDEPNFLYQNNGDGTFTKVFPGDLAFDTDNAHGSAWGDYNNDGWQDLFVANNDDHNAIYINNGDGSFTRVYNEMTDDWGLSFGSAWADIDRDGDLDLFVANRDDDPNFLYINQKWNCSNFACIRLVGNASNKSGIGARIMLTADIDGQEVTQTQQISAQTGGGTGSQNDITAHFGLGDATIIKSIAVIWPSGFKQELTNEPINQCLTIEEPDASEITGFVYYVEDVNCDDPVGGGTLPAGAQAATYRTVSDGEWTESSTWLDGNVPPTSLNNVTVSVEHNVTHEGNLKLTNGAKLWITNANLFIEDGDFSMSNTEVYFQGAQFEMGDGNFTISSQQGLFVARQSKINVQGNFTTYGTDTLEQVCFEVGGNLNPTLSFSTWTNVLANVGGNFQTTFASLLMNETKIKVVDGNFIAASWSVIDGSGLVIWVQNGSLQNSFATWTAGIDQYCSDSGVLGISLPFLPGNEVCGGIDSHFSAAACGGMLVQVSNTAGTNNTGDPNRVPIPNCRVVINPGNITVYSDENGYYSANVPTGVCEVTVHPDNNWVTTCPTPDGALEVDVLEIGQRYENNDFGHEALCTAPDMNVEVAITAHRVGFENLMVINYENIGATTGTSAQLLLYLPDGITAVEASTPWNGNAPAILIWDLGNLPAGDNGAIYLTYLVDINLPINTTLNINATLSCLEGDCNASNDAFLHSALTVGGIDPNDILVSPEGGIDKEQELTYKIRFQNVGNAPVANVRIENELPEGLDLSTLEIGAASHNYQFRAEGQKLIWTFPSINLPDSVHHEPQSHGFVTYRIRPKADWAIGEKILNQANIYFDNLAPVITNTVSNFILAEPKEGGKPNRLHIFPNPASTTLMAQFGQPDLLSGDAHLQTVELYDPIGRLVLRRHQDSGYRMQLDLEKQPPGLYSVHGIDDQGRRFVGKVVIVASE